MEDVNKTTGGDVGYALGKGAISMIPFLGALAAELFGMLITPPLEKRRAEWMNDIAARLDELEKNRDIDLSKLAENEQFIDSVLQATSFALKTSEDEKIKALQNAVINTALGDCPEKAQAHVFLNLIDTFTAWHIRLLLLFREPTQWFLKNGQHAPNLMMGGLTHVIYAAYPELKGRDSFLNLIWNDLKNAGFHRTSELNVTMSGSGLLQPRTTDFAEEFLDFISSHK